LITRLENQLEQTDHHNQADNEDDANGAAEKFQHADAPSMVSDSSVVTLPRRPGFSLFLECLATGRAEHASGARAANDPDAVFHLRFARHAHGTPGDGIQGDVPEAAGGYANLRRELDEGAAVVTVPTTVPEGAKVGIVHQADVAGLRTLDDHQIALFQMLALMDEFHRIRTRW
jgi:hypothetical protein